MTDRLAPPEDGNGDIRRILIIDDEEAIRKFIKIHLNKAGYDVIQSGGGRDVFYTVDEEDYDLLVCDLRMPGIDGYKILDRVVAMEGNTPVIMLTGVMDVTTAVDIMKLGAFDYISKPVKKDLLLTTVSKALEQKDILDKNERLENENREYQEFLEDKVQERTLALTRKNKELEAAYAKSRDAEAQLRLHAKVIECTVEGVVVTDPVGVIQSVNPAFTTITGYEEGEAIGQTPRLLKSGRHDSEFYKNMWDELAEKGVWKGEIWNKRKNGEIYAEWLTISAIRDSFGKTTQYAGVLNDITAIKQSEDEIKYQAYHDSLTGLPNRQMFEEHISRSVSNHRRTGKMLAVLFLDLDDFKIVNDSRGHAAGDLLLKGAALRLVTSLREEDIICRFGGDEFIILLENMNSESETVIAAQRIIKVLSEPYLYMGEALRSSTSIGISMFPLDGQKGDELIKNADIAMYHAKTLGKSNYQFYSEALNEKLMKRVELDGRLRKAIELGEIVTYYQPKIDLLASQVMGAEALIRWNPAGGPMVSPADFIPAAEESDLICSLGELMLLNACRQVNEWQKDGFGFLSVSVNVSAHQLEDKRIVRAVQSILEITGINPGRLELEVTESAVMKDVNLAISIMEELSAMGVRLSIDDFGTGYSSLSYLKKFPINRLKIDRSFVQDILTNVNDRAIANATISMGHSMGLKVLAEGLETKQQLELLMELGCDEAQGYYFGAAIPASEFNSNLLNGKMSFIDHFALNA